MSKSYFEGETHEGSNFSIEGLPAGDYEQCTFKNCHFAGTDLSGIGFAECTFEHCDLSNARLGNTALRDIRFKNCKLLGLHFEDCSGFLFAVTCEGCQLDLSSFYRRSLKDAVFKDCSLREVDFVEADLTGVGFDGCELTGAIFQQTILEKTDFSKAINYSINPEQNRIRKAKFSSDGVRGLLDHFDIEIV